jgi:hypothetical protein
MLSRTACGRPGTLSVWETWKPRPGAVSLSFVPSVLVCISICMIPTGMCLQACEFTTLAGHWLWPALYRAPRYGSAARATLPARRRTSHGSGCPPTLAGPAAALGAARSGAETHDETVAYGSRGIRVASEPTVGRDGLSSGAKPARRRAATATEAEGSVVWTRRCLRLLAAVSYRVL